MNKLHNSNPSSIIASLPPSCLSTIVTTRLTSYPKSRNTFTALIAEPPVVTTSSNTVIVVGAAPPLRIVAFGGNGPYTCDAVPYPFGSLRIIKPLNLYP